MGEKENNNGITLDLTKTVNEVVENSLGKPTKEVGNILGTTLGFFKNTILYPMQKYNIYAEAKLEAYAKELEEKMLEIPEDKLVESSVNILGPAIEGLKYNLNEEHIKEMFTKIITGDMHADIKGKMQPSYIEVVKQLSKDDALFLKEFVNYKTSEFYAIDLQLKAEKIGFKRIGRIIAKDLSGNEGLDWLDEIVIDNLSRLNLVELRFDEYFTNDALYEKIFENVKNRCDGANKEKLQYKKGMLKLTTYGKNFVEICIK